MSWDDDKDFEELHKEEMRNYWRSRKMNTKRRRRRMVTMSDNARISEPKKEIYGFCIDDFAQVLGISVEACRKRVLRGLFDPTELKSFAEEVIRQHQKLEKRKAKKGE